MHRTDELLKQASGEETVHVVDGKTLRARCIDDEYYVAMEDFSNFIQGSVQRIVELARQQQEHVAAIEAMMAVFNDVLAERYPEIQEAVMEEARSRLKMA